MAGDPIEDATDAALAASVAWAKSVGAVAWACPSRSQVRAMAEAAGPVFAGTAEAKLAEIRETVETFLAHYGDSGLASLRVAGDLAHGILQVLDRDRETQERAGEKEPQ